MIEPGKALARQAGTAVFWKGIQLLGRRSISTIRLLILARILLPEDFGLFSIALVVVETVMSLTDFGMLPAIVQMKEPSAKSYDSAWTINVVKAFLIVILILVLAPVLAELFQEPRATNLIRLLALRPLIDSLASTKTAELTRQLKFERLTLIFLPAILLETIVSIVLADSMGVLALVAGAVVGALLCVVLSYALAPYRPRACFELEHIRPLIQFGRWIFLTKIIAVAGSGVLQVVISRRLGAVSLGLYYLALKLAFLPNDFAGEVVGAVAFPLYARLQQDGERLAAVFRTVLTGLAALLIPTYALLLVLAPAIVEHLLGEKWQGTAPIIRVLSLVGIAGLFGDAVVPVLQGTGRPYLVAILELWQSSAIILSVTFLAEAYGSVGAASAWLVAIVPSQLITIYFVHRIVVNPYQGVGKPVVGVVVAAALAAAVAALTYQAVGGLPGLLLSVSVAGLLTIGCYWLIDKRLKLELTTKLLNIFPEIARRFEMRL